MLLKHNIHYFILKAGDSVHDKPDDNGPNMNQNNLYGNARMNRMRHHGTLKFTPDHCRGAMASVGVGMLAQGKQRAHENYKAGRARK